MFKNFYLRATRIACPNKDCRYVEGLACFAPLAKEEDYNLEESFSVKCECPECGQPFIAHITSHLSFFCEKEEKIKTPIQ